MLISRQMSGISNRQSRLTRRSLLGIGAIVAIGGALTLGTPSVTVPASASAHSTLAPAPEGKEWATVWEDRFLDDELDETVWTRYDGPGQGDLRDQQYNNPDMVEVRDGRLVLTAEATPKNGFAYSAGTVSTAGKQTIGPFGRLTTRQYLYPGNGLSFGVVLFGEDLEDVGWPEAGEIDATEISLARPGSPFGSVHGPGYSGSSPISATYDGPLDSLAGRWVDHTLEWEPGVLRWAIDGQIYHEARASDSRASAGWPFDDRPYFVVLTTTVGSWLGGDVDLSTWPKNSAGVSSTRAEIDYIRFEQLVDC